MEPWYFTFSEQRTQIVSTVWTATLNCLYCPLCSQRGFYARVSAFLLQPRHRVLYNRIPHHHRHTYVLIDIRGRPWVWHSIFRVLLPVISVRNQRIYIGKALVLGKFDCDGVKLRSRTV